MFKHRCTHVRAIPPDQMSPWGGGGGGGNFLNKVSWSQFPYEFVMRHNHYCLSNYNSA